jgi:exonuclease III
MWYYMIPDTPTGKRTAQRLLALKEQLAGDDGVPAKREDTLLLATWNIREFDSPAYGARDLEPLYYIAEIISHFDLVAVQEVREDLDALEEVLDILGWQWRYIATDVTEGRPGNRERMAFLHNTDKVSFGGIAGEIVVPPIEKRAPDGGTITYDPSKQLARTPFLCAFRAGWSRFMLCTVHILYGKDTAADPRRVEEIRKIARFIAKRGEEDTSWSKNLILLGDFNIFDPSDVTMKEITNAGFVVPAELQSLEGTNVGKKGRHYDQIAFLPRAGRLESTGRAGVFDFFDTVYTSDDEAIYVDDMGERYHTTKAGNPRTPDKKTQYYRTYWRTHQMSDHLPMWIELKIDFGKEYLEEKAG